MPSNFWNRVRRSSLVLVLCLATPALTATPVSLPDLFQRAKAQFNAGKYSASLADFLELDRLNRQPGAESERGKLAPVIDFYRGANLVALGQEDEGRKHFALYLAAVPNARIDPMAFPERVVEVFNGAVKLAAKDGVAAQDRGMAADYAIFQLAAVSSAPADSGWGDSAVRFLFDKQEKREWKTLADPQEREKFVARFWARRDPSPLTPENEYRLEFERRVRFSDARLSTEAKKGSESDRGLVFALLGPPSYIGRVPLDREDDPLEALRTKPTKVVTISPQGRRVVTYNPNRSGTTEVFQGTREIWHYRSDRIPSSIKYNELDFEFVTKEGYGEGILERDHKTITALEEAAKTGLLP